MKEQSKCQKFVAIDVKPNCFGYKKSMSMCLFFAKKEKKNKKTTTTYVALKSIIQVNFPTTTTQLPNSISFSQAHYFIDVTRGSRFWKVTFMLFLNDLRIIEIRL